jgi:hypothetical protein
MRPSHVWLVLALALALDGCTIPIDKVEREPGVQSAPEDPLILHDLGLSCDQCMFSWGSGCSILNAASAPLVAVAKGSKVADELQECLQADSSSGSQRCIVHRAYRFDDLQFLRRPTEFDASDAFAASDRVDSANPKRHAGVLLMPDKRYVIIANPPDSATSPRADWNLAAACEVPPNATFPTR